MENIRVFRPLSSVSYPDFEFLAAPPPELDSAQPEILSLDAIGISYAGKRALQEMFKDNPDAHADFVNAVVSDLPDKSFVPLETQVVDVQEFGRKNSLKSFRRPTLVLEDRSGLLEAENEIVRRHLPTTASLPYFRPHISPAIVVKGNMDSTTRPLLLDWLAETSPDTVTVDPINLIEYTE